MTDEAWREKLQADARWHTKDNWSQFFPDVCLRNFCCHMTTSTLIGEKIINKNFKSLDKNVNSHWGSFNDSKFSIHLFIVGRKVCDNDLDKRWSYFQYYL